MIFGTGTVNKIYDEVVAQGLPTASKDEQKAEAAKQGNWFQRAIRSFGDVFVPLLPAIVATGLFMVSVEQSITIQSWFVRYQHQKLLLLLISILTQLY